MRPCLRAGLAAVCLAIAVPASAQAVEGCDPAALHGPDLTTCLTEAAKTSDAALASALEAALASIHTRQGVFDAQRARWRNSLVDSQGLWLRWRNAESQEVAPFEGQAAPTNAASTNALKNRVAAFDAKLGCTIRANQARAAELVARYPAP